MIHSSLKIIIIGFVVGTLSQGAIKKCTSHGSPNYLTANCSGIFFGNDSNIPSPPSYLDKNLKVLDISRNEFDDLNNKSFVQYPKLKILLIRNVKRRPTSPANITETEKKPVHFKVAVDLFKPLEDLQELDLTGTLFDTFVLDFEWPLKLTILRMSSMNMSNFRGLPTLVMLEEINLSNNSLRSVPSLNKGAPIRVIDLDDNPLEKVAVSEIASFCQLQELGLRVKRDSALLKNSSTFCECDRLNKWIEKREIFVEERLKCKPKTTYHLGEHDVNNCSYNFEEENKVFDMCNNKLGITPWELLLYAVFFFVLFPILYFGFDTYNRFSQARSADEGTRRRGQSSKISKAGDSKSSLAGEMPSSDYEGDAYDHDSDFDQDHDHDHHEDHDYDHRHDYHHDDHRSDHDPNHSKGFSKSKDESKYGSDVKKK